MSILIKDMGMPKSCEECRLYEDGYCFLLNNTVEDSSRRHSKCPLVEIPPHGRLIDADELLEHMKKIHDKWKLEGHYTPTTDDEIMTMNMPTIIEAEE